VARIGHVARRLPERDLVGLEGVRRRRVVRLLPRSAGRGAPSEQGRSQAFTIPAGSYVYPYLEGTCYVDGHDFRHQAFTEGEPIFVAPYIWYPTFVGPGRSLQASGAVVLRRGKTVTARFRVVENATGKERVTVSFRGAGVRVRKVFAPGQLDLARRVTFRPLRAGVIRYWATMEGRSSLVYGIRVR
jgi:hypothetical protein